MTGTTIETIRIECQGCGRAADVPTRFAGGKVKCKGCATTLRVPSAARPEAEPAARCEECGKGIREGLERCGACGPRETPVRLLLRSLLFVGLGLPVAVVGGAFAFSVSQAMGVAMVVVWLGFALGVVAALAGGVDLLLAVFALVAGAPVAKPQATRWLLEQLQVE